MKIKVFMEKPEKKFLGAEFVPSALESEINQWFSENPAIKVEYVKHDVVSGFGAKPMIIISVYYV
jgi:hypothetical protein